MSTDMRGKLDNPNSSKVPVHWEEQAQQQEANDDFADFATWLLSYGWDLRDRFDKFKRRLLGEWGIKP